MTHNNPNPLANPLNSGRFSNTTAFSGRSYIRRCADPSKLEVPNQDVPAYGSDAWIEQQRRLTVPNQDVPPGNQLRGNGFIAGSDNLFRLSDGTVVDFKNCRIVGQRKDVPGYWGDPNRTISHPCDLGNSWNAPHDFQNPSLEDLVCHTERYEGRAIPDGSLAEPLDAYSAAYWLKAEEEAKKMESQMTDGQKQLFADFEKHFPKSKLIEESLKK